MEKLSCEVIQDLIPVYLDGLASEESAKLVEAHTADCEDCKKLIEVMKEPKKDEAEEKEIDFLKKTKRKSRKALWITIVIAILVAAAGVLLYPYVSFHKLERSEMDASFAVDERQLSIQVESQGYMGIHKLSFEEEDGVVTIRVQGAKKGLFAYDSLQGNYVANDQIKQVRLENSIIWDNGVKISEETAETFATKHAYIGDASANFRTMYAMGVGEKFGSFKMELKTSEEPYGMLVSVDEKVNDSNKGVLSTYSRLYSYQAMAVIDNLSYVTFQFRTVDGELLEFTWSVEDAKEFLGKDVKLYGENEVTLEKLTTDYWSAVQ